MDPIEVERISWTDSKWYRFALGQTGMYETKRVEVPGMDARREANVTRPNFALIREFINKPTDNQ